MPSKKKKDAEPENDPVLNSELVNDEPADAPADQPVAADGQPVSHDPNGQGFLPGSEPVYHADVIAAATKYDDTKKKRMDLTKKENEDLNALAEIMDKHKLSEYHYGDVHVTIDTKRKVKVQVGVKNSDEE